VVGAEGFKMWSRIATPMTGLAFDKRISAMELDESIATCPCQRMQPIDILGNDH
jgi:hypothetical protein